MKLLHFSEEKRREKRVKDGRREAGGRQNEKENNLSNLNVSLFIPHKEHSLYSVTERHTCMTYKCHCMIQNITTLKIYHMQHGTLLQNSSSISSRNTFNNICLGKGSHFPGKFQPWYNLMLHLFTSWWRPWIWIMLSILPLEFPQALLFPLTAQNWNLMHCLTLGICCPNPGHMHIIVSCLLLILFWVIILCLSCI